eukprot:CAMPEP_0168607688 /NCGR_PEP_ID=MMETSP0449_2-20121227/195_1 /TAXON_ID=1082188 /ORGANISM="Strombidium rassoulzadegani, Strain ras09" /LENGTH=56 /DNA_ID=CAMNT_0008647559 /DNA_START=207 /DNA_END=377 /DNA_ORIENTATION=-
MSILVRGKPWLVTIDDRVPCETQTTSCTLSYADGSSQMWVALLEKAWAKVKGTYQG